jgi:hypothetical protein
MRFVLFDSVIAGQCRIGEFWSRRGEPGLQYFIWKLLFTLASFLGLGLIIGIPLLFAFFLGWFADPRAHLVPIVLCSLLAVAVFIAFIVTLLCVHVLVKDFVIPQMALERITLGDGWQRLWEMMKQEKGGFAGYLGMKVVLAIAAGVIFAVLTLIAFVVLLLPVGGLGVLVVLWGKASGMQWTPLTIAIAIAVGIVVVAALISIAALIAVPVIVFFPAYSIYFFADRYAPLRTALHPITDSGGL